MRAIGGTWNKVRRAPGETPALTADASASTPRQVVFAFGFPVTRADGLPVQFSWPIREGPRGQADLGRKQSHYDDCYDPTKGVRYTSPGPAQVQPVTDALKNPMTVTFIR